MYTERQHTQMMDGVRILRSAFGQQSARYESALNVLKHKPPGILHGLHNCSVSIVLDHSVREQGMLRKEVFVYL
jgi:hypothetical protein